MKQSTATELRLVHEEIHGIHICDKYLLNRLMRFEEQIRAIHNTVTSLKTDLDILKEWVVPRAISESYRHAVTKD